MLKYLIISQFARLITVFFTAFTGIVCLIPTQILVCGLVMDMLAVMVISFEKPSNDILLYKTDVEARLKKPLPYVLQSVLFGLFWAVNIIAAPMIASAAGYPLDAASLSSSAFIGFLCTQFIVMSEVKKEKSVFVPNIKMSGVYILTFVCCAAFIACCLIFPAFGLCFGIIRPGISGAIVAAAPAVIMTLLFELYKALNKGSV